MYVVYGLEDPRDGLYHYIGITDDVYRRFHQHTAGDGGNIRKNGWIFECRQANLMIVMRELERVDTLENALTREKHWIGYYLDLGHPLSNMTVAKSILKERVRLEKLARRNQTQPVKPERTSWNHPSDSRHERTKEYRESMLPKALEAWEQGHKTVRGLAKHINTSEWYARHLIKEIKTLQTTDRAG